MITLTLNWAWLFVIAILIVGIGGFVYFATDSDHFGFRETMGCLFLVFCILVALVIGGLFIW